jgi:hypothetical protein
MPADHRTGHIDRTDNGIDDSIDQGSWFRVPRLRPGLHAELSQLAACYGADGDCVQLVSSILPIVSQKVYEVAHNAGAGEGDPA